MIKLSKTQTTMFSYREPLYSLLRICTSLAIIRALPNMPLISHCSRDYKHRHIKAYQTTLGSYSPLRSKDMYQSHVRTLVFPDNAIFTNKFS